MVLAKDNQKKIANCFNGRTDMALIQNQDYLKHKIFHRLMFN